MNLSIDKNNYYKILGLSSDATQTQIEKAFKKILEEYQTKSDHSDAEKREFLGAYNAYQTLKDTEKRKAYDRTIFTGAEKNESTDKIESTEELHEKNLTPFPKIKEVLRNNKYRLVVDRVVTGGLILVAVFAGYNLGKTTSKDTTDTTEMSYYSTTPDGKMGSNDSENSLENEDINQSLMLTADNIDEKVQEILSDNQSRGLNIDPTFIKSALFITNIDYLDQEDIKEMWKNNDLNIIEEIQNMYNYTSAVGTHNNNVALGQKEGKYIALSNLAFDEEDKTVLRELDTEFVDLVNGLQSDMTSEEYQQSFKYITEFYNGFGYLSTNGTEYSNYSLTAGGGLLSEQYWPMFSVIYSDSKYLTNENAIDIKTLSYGTDGTDAVINGSKYLGSIVNHESLQCLDRPDTKKTLTKTQ